MDIPLGIAAVTYTTDHGDPLTFHRPTVAVLFLQKSGQWVRLRSIVDTGAPLSVVPFAVWNDRQLAWSSVSKKLTRAGRVSALLWQGVPCELGYTDVDLSGRRRLIAKLVLGPTALADVILGLNFLIDNDIELALRAVGGCLSGFLTAP